MAPRRAEQLQLHLSSDAYSSMALLTALLFGFSLTGLLEVEPASFNDVGLQRAFFVLMVLVLGLSAYTTIVMTFSYYFVSRLLADGRPDLAMSFLTHTFMARHVARALVQAAFVTLFAAVAVILWDRLSRGVAGVATAILCVFIVVTLVAVNTMRTAYKACHSQTRQHTVRLLTSEHGDHMAQQDDSNDDQEQQEHSPHEPRNRVHSV